MPLTRQQKEARVEEAQAALQSAVSLVVMSYDALSLADMGELRDKLHAAGVKMRVVPKRLLKRAVAEAKLELDPLTFDGQLAVVWGDDAVAPAKVLYEFAKTHEQVQLKAGFMEQAVLSEEEVTALAQLPGRDELLAKLVGTLAGPISGFQQVLSGVPRSAVYVLSAIAEKNKE